MTVCGPGVNTLGCWSDEKLQKDRKTPYVLISSIWWQANGHRKFPFPFRESFQSDLEKNLRKLSWAKNDPYCLGIFMGNELEWPDRIGPTIENLPPEHPTKKWALRELKKLGKPTTPAKLNDLESLYLPFVRSFFSKCKREFEKELPGTLYLGCRTHRGPSVLGRGALGSVGVFPVNDSRVRSWQVPEDTDIPIISSEFHFGAVDRGVPSKDCRVPGTSGKEPCPSLTTSPPHWPILVSWVCIGFSGSISPPLDGRTGRTINADSLMSPAGLTPNLPRWSRSRPRECTPPE